MEEKRYNPRLTKSREEFIQLMKSFDLAHATENQMGKIFQFSHDERTVNSWSILISFYRAFPSRKSRSTKPLLQYA